MKRTSFFLTEQQIEKINKLVKKTGLKIAEIIRRAIDEYLEKHV